VHRLLYDEGKLVLVFPEGRKGTEKLIKDRYRLRRFGRGGFVEAAMRAEAQIVEALLAGLDDEAPRRRRRGIDAPSPTASRIARLLAGRDRRFACNRLARAIARVDQIARPERREGRLVARRVVALPQRVRTAAEGVGGAFIGLQPQPVQIVEQRRFVLRAATRPIVILEPEQDATTVCAGEAPHADGVRHVTEMQQSGRRWREPGGPSGRKGVERHRRSARPPSGGGS